MAGLEVQSPGGAGWTYPEVQGRAGVDVAVLVGESLHDLAPIFPMAVHRVMTPRFFNFFFNCIHHICIDVPTHRLNEMRVDLPAEVTS